MIESCVFFFKQETAYEMRISDWSSDVCSSDQDRGSCTASRSRIPERPFFSNKVILVDLASNRSRRGGREKQGIYRPIVPTYGKLRIPPAQYSKRPYSAARMDASDRSISSENRQNGERSARKSVG